MNCTHSWKMYTGLTESFEYCSACDIKRGQEPERPVGLTSGMALMRSEGAEMTCYGKIMKEAWDAVADNLLKDLYISSGLYGAFYVSYDEPEEQIINVTKSEFLKAVGLAYTTPENSSKVLDHTLAMSIWEQMELDFNGEPEESENE